MLSPSASSGSIRYTGRRRALVHPGVRTPFPDAHGIRPQECKDTRYSKLSHPTTLQQAVEQISYLIKSEIKQFEELASSVKGTYGVSLTYTKPHVDHLLGSMRGNVSLDIPSGQELPIASDSLFQFSRDPLDHGTDSSLLDPFSAAKRLGRYGSSCRPKNRKITVPPSKPNHSDSKRYLNSGLRRFDDATSEHPPTHVANLDHLSAVSFEIPDPDSSLSSSATNESYSENLYDWLQTQGTQTKSNVRNDDVHHTPPSPQACSTTEDTPLSRRGALNGRFVDHRSSGHFRPLSPPPTIRPRKTRVQALPSALGSARLGLGSSQHEYVSASGLGLILPSHLGHDAGVSSLEGSHAANTEVFSSLPQIETKERQQHLDGGLADLAPSQSEDLAGRPLPTVLAHFMQVIAELKLKSTQRGAYGTSSLSEKAAPWAVQSESASDCGLPNDIAEGVQDGHESVKKLAKRLLEQGLSQEEQSQKLRILAETLCEIALLRRALSGMLSSKYETEQ